MAQQILPSNTFTTAKWIVSATASDGTHTTIAAALTSASSGDTIFIRPGTYTENLTLKAGVNLTAFGSDSSLNQTGKVIISGKATLTTTGSVTISGIQLQTNSDFLLAVTGTLASIVCLQNCNLNCLNNTGISFTSSSASALINILNCTGDLGTTGIGYFTASSAGTMNIFNCYFTNSGSSLTATTTSATAINIGNCNFNAPLSTSSSGAIGISNSSLNCVSINTTVLTTAGTGTSTLANNYMTSGSASTVSIGSGTTVGMYLCNVSSSNTNAITGAGTINYTGISFSGSSTTINTTTQTNCGTIQGSKNTAPAAGFLGEQIRAGNSGGSALSNNTPFNLTSISLTAGIWDVSGLAQVNFSGASQGFTVSLSATSATITGNPADQQASCNPTFAGATNLGLSVPSFRVTLSSTTTYYLVVNAIFSTGGATGYGRISGTRVG